MKKAFIFLGIAAVILIGIGPVHAEGNTHSCKVCGMYIESFKDTSAVLDYKDGRHAETCGVACMLRLINDEGGPDAFSSIKVHGWHTKQLVDADKATYVIGSRVVPDMIPNIIAFADREGAEQFRTAESGALLSFTQALLSISPMGMTMPARIKTAVLPPKGVFSAGIGYMRMEMDKVKLDTDSADPAEFVGRPMQMMGPKKMQSSGEMLMTSYAFTDDLTVNLTIPYLEKKMEMYTMSGKAFTTTKNDGLGDIEVSGRYGLWKNEFYSKFLSVLAGTTLPTGDFDTQYLASPGLQLGTGNFSATAGLLFSNRIKDFWFHYMASYRLNIENSDDYRFGDVASLGAAAHYTPNYNLMLGVEIDGKHYAKNENQGKDVDNTGGFRSYVTGIVNWKFLTAMGGNFNIRLVGGVPVYENLNHYAMGSMEKVQLGGGYFANVMLSFKRRFPPF
jgi:hypothetical protein